MKVAKQAIEFYKMNFDNAFKAMTILQDQTQKISNMQLSYSVGVPEEGKKAISEWFQAYKKASEQFKTAMDDNFKKLETYFTDEEE